MARKITIEFLGNARDLQRTVGQVQGSTSKLGSRLKKVGVAAGVGFAILGTAAVKYGAKAIGAASDLNETLSKSQAIFGKQAPAMEKWANGAASAAGLSKSAALEAASGFGDMFSQIGFASDAAADMSKSVVQMSADLGSFNNLPTADVTDRIAAAFRGEYDSLQKVIPNINAARVETEALAATGKESAKQLTAQEKATAVLAIVQKDGARAMGDFKRTSGGLANQQKILSARLENVKAKIGQALLPMAVKAAKFFNDKMIPVIQRVADWFGKKLVPSVGRVVDWFKKSAKESDGLGGALEDLKKFVGDAKRAWDALSPVLMKVAKVVVPLLIQNFRVAMKALRLFGEAATFMWNNLVAPVIRRMLSGFSSVARMVAAMFRAMSHAPGMGWLKPLADKLDRAANAAGGLSRNIRDIPSYKKVTLDVVTRRYDIRVAGNGGSAGGLVPGAAHGTSHHRGGPLIVGERGTELVTLPRGSKVTPHQETMGILRKASSQSQTAGATDGGLHVHFHGPVAGDPRSFARAVRDVLLREKRLIGTDLGLA